MPHTGTIQQTIDAGASKTIHVYCKSFINDKPCHYMAPKTISSKALRREKSIVLFDGHSVFLAEKLLPAVITRSLRIFQRPSLIGFALLGSLAACASHKRCAR